MFDSFIFTFKEFTMYKFLKILWLCLLSNIAYADSWGGMKWGQNPWGPDSEPSASYEFSTGLLTMKNVDVGGKHFYVELQNQGFGGNFEFGLSRTVPLDHPDSILMNQTVYDTKKLELKIPHVFAGGQYYSVGMKNDQFLVFKISSIVASREKHQDHEIIDEAIDQVLTEEVIDQDQVLNEEFVEQN